MSSLELLERRLMRERAARKEAEALLDQKSREVYEANQQLRELADHTKAIVETAAEGIITYDLDGVIRSFNRSAQRIFQRELGEGLNVRDLFEVTPVNESKLFECSIIARGPDAADDDEPLMPEPVEFIGIRSTGKTFVSEVSISCTTIGEVAISTALIRDLSRRKKLEARLSQAQKMESVGQLASGIAHEINTPIQFIGNNIQFLQGAFEDLGGLLALFEQLVDAVESGASTADLLQSIEQQREIADLSFLRQEFPGAIEQSMEGIEHVAKIVRAMKEFSQPASKNASSFDLNRAVENALAVSASQYRDVATVETALDPNGQSLIGLGGQLNQVLLNVISNACEAVSEHCEPGAGKIQISTCFSDDSVELRIQDNGPGIPPEIIDRIFEPFFTTKAVGTGTGQGLAFVYDVIVNKHEGTILAQSLPGQGTTLMITLPITTISELKRRQHANSLA